MLVLFTGVIPASAIVGCGASITTDITLTHDLTCSGTGLVIGADGITVDLDGFTLTNIPIVAASNGVDNTGGFDGVTIENGAIIGFEQGIRAVGANELTLKDLTFSGQTSSHAIDILDSDDVTIEDSSITLAPYSPIDTFGCLFGIIPGPEAIRLQNVDGFTVKDVDVDGGFIGVNFALDPNGGETNGVVEDSIFTDNFAGVLIADSSDATVKDNEISGACNGIKVGFGFSPPTPTGIKLSENELSENIVGISAFVFGQRTFDIEIKENDIRDNESDGILLLNVHDSKISENVVEDNGANGIALFDSGLIIANELEENTALGNGGGISPILCLFFGLCGTFDMLHDVTSTNNWEENTCGTSSGADIDCP